MQVFLAITALLSGQSQAAEIFKCKTADGRTIFSSAGCGTEVGEYERPDIKVNEVGSLATPSEIQQLHRDRDNAKIQRVNDVKVIVDSSKEDTRTVSGNVNKRLRIKEETMDREHIPDPSGVTVIRNTAGETQRQRAMRLRTDSIEQDSR